MDTKVQMVRKPTYNLPGVQTSLRNWNFEVFPDKKKTRQIALLKKCQQTVTIFFLRLFLFLLNSCLKLVGTDCTIELQL